MAYVKACEADELWEGDMVEVDVNDHVVVLVWPNGGEIHAYQGICPHQDIPLVEGKFDGEKVICRAHLWQFDAVTGKGINPSDCALAEYPVKVDGDDILVETEGVEALFAHT